MMVRDPDLEFILLMLLAAICIAMGVLNQI